MSNAITYRLNKNVNVKHYHIDIDTSPRRKGFSGTATLELRLTKASTVIELNARGLRCNNVRLISGKSRRKGVARARKARETIECIFDKPVPKGKAILTVDFRGQLNPSMHGLYLAQDGAQRAIASQAEAADARAIFPCLDEPEFKSTIQWTVRTDPGLCVVTNGVLDKTTLQTRGGVKREVHLFKRTKKISTYLIAISIGDFDVSKTVRIAKTPCRFFTDRGKIDQAQFAEEVTRFVLPWYEEYFAHRYHFQKLDQVAIPGFDAGAMENIGAIFYRQSLLLMQEGVTSWRGQKTIAEVIAHEIAHQWFGNLVTMKWWDDLWLNEAFATWIAYKVTNLWKPQWRMWDEYLAGKEGALQHDALIHTHPIYTAVSSPDEATELFDLITYQKGCAVLRMVESYLGEEAFRRGIQLYIQRFKNGNAEGSDLWAALSDTSGEDVSALMGSWIEQSGFPLLSVSLNNNKSLPELQLSQRRFFAHKEEQEALNDTQWNIPIVIRYGTTKTGTSKTMRVLLAEKDMTVPLPPNTLWAYPNADASGFYRMQFNAVGMRALLQADSDDGASGLQSLGPAEKVTLLADQWALVVNGLSSVADFMDVLDRLRQERDHMVVQAIVAHLSNIYRTLVPEETRTRFGEFVRAFMAPQLSELGWDSQKDESPETAVRRRAVIFALGDIGHDEEVLDEAERRTLEEQQHPHKTNANVASALTALAAIRGGKSRLQEFLKVYLERKERGDAPELQSRYLGALSCFEKPGVAKLVLEACLDGTVPQEQLRTVLVPMLARPATQALTWRFLKKNWVTISPKIGAMGISRLVEATGALGPFAKTDVQRFFKQHPVEGAKRALSQALETMDLRGDIVAREAKTLTKWLKA